MGHHFWEKVYSTLVYLCCEPKEIKDLLAVSQYTVVVCLFCINVTLQLHLMLPGAAYRLINSFLREEHILLGTALSNNELIIGKADVMPVAQLVITLAITDCVLKKFCQHSVLLISNYENII